MTLIRKNRSVAIWLFIGAFMIMIQVLIGGVTRLTGSGLSITEWQPILGTLPPLNEAAWLRAFEKYQQIAQYKYIHNYFTLSDFKFIYFWEWFHRNWARLMGLVFLVPFIYFLFKGKINRGMFWPMLILFLLGGLQGAIGWIMVRSGIGTDLVYVSPVRLAIHFMAALILLVYIIWFALKISVSEGERTYAPALFRFTLIILTVLALQLIYGALMAGSHAGKAAVTWPSINGTYFPALITGSEWEGIFYEPVAVQFIHRNLAYLLFILIVVYTVALYAQPRNERLYKLRNLPLALVFVQIILGVITLVNYLGSHMIWLSLLHQLFGMLLLVSLVLTAYFCRGRKYSGSFR